MSINDKIDAALGSAGLDDDPDRPVRGSRLTARVGLLLGLCFAVCFITGLISHWIQHPPSWFSWPTHPVWLYRLTQGMHVTTGVAAIPLLIIKLAIVYPKLFAKPRIGSPARLIERLSIAVLVASSMFQLVTGLLNTAQWYPWKFFFTTSHYAVAWIALGSLLVHIAVKLPIIRAALDAPVDALDPGVEDSRTRARGPAPHKGRLSRRAVLHGAWALSGLAAVATVGQALPYARWLSFLAPRSGHGPQGIPVNRTVAQATMGTEVLRSPSYTLTLVADGREMALSRQHLHALPQTSRHLPIACVEGWSASGIWHGVVLRDVLAQITDHRGRNVRMVSLDRGLYGITVLPANFADDPDTLLALGLNGEELSLDHGYPCRLIAPNRPGVLQTKWLSRIEVL